MKGPLDRSGQGTPERSDPAAETHTPETHTPETHTADADTGTTREPPKRASRTRVRVAVSIGGREEVRRGYEVTAPDRLLRAWTMLVAVEHELHETHTPPDVRVRAERALGVARSMLQESLSEPLIAEMRDLLPELAPKPSLAELRIAYAAMCGWVDALVNELGGELLAVQDALGQSRTRRLPALARHRWDGDEDAADGSGEAASRRGRSRWDGQGYGGARSGPGRTGGAAGHGNVPPAPGTAGTRLFPSRPFFPRAVRDQDPTAQRFPSPHPSPGGVGHP